jgi:glycosyltransferase involved in cell wall biosynthesis
VRIACISTSLIPSNTANSIQVMKVCEAMTELGHQVSLWVPGTDVVQFEKMIQLYGLKNEFEVTWLRSIKSFKRYDFAISSLGAASAWKANLIYTWLPQAAWGGLTFLKKPAVLEMHDRASGKFGLYWLKKFLNSEHKKELVVVSRALQEALEMQISAQIPGNEVVIAPNGVDLKRYEIIPDCYSARQSLNLEQILTIGYTGHFYAGRGIEILFNLAEAYPEVQFLWIGGRENELEEVRGRLEQEQLLNVVLTGFVDNSQIGLYQAACEILLMPYEKSIAGSSGGNSVDICSPMKMFEYMAAGRAIISSDLPVLHEVLDDESVLFCPPEDSSAWIQAVGDLIADPLKRNSIASHAKDKIQNYSITNRQKMILEILSEQ